MLFVYGLIVFVDQTAGQLENTGKGLLVSPYIWASNVSWPTNGFLAFGGLLMALTGFFFLCLKAERSRDPNGAIITHLLRTVADTLILFFAVCLCWELFLSTLQPETMKLQIIQLLSGTGISNIFVLNFSAISLPIMLAIKMRGSIVRWLSRWPIPRKLASNPGLSYLSFGALTAAVAFEVANSFNTFTAISQPISYCGEICYFIGTLDLVGGIAGVILSGIGIMVLTERLFPRERIV